MLMLVTYDVNTTSAEGVRRLRKIAKVCQNYGMRVQNSVFEINLGWDEWLVVRAKLETICDPMKDSLRYYNLGNAYQTKVIHFGAKPPMDVVKDSLII